MYKEKQLLITRKLKQSQRDLFDTFDGIITEIDFIQTKEIQVNNNIEILDALLFTSQNAVKSFLNQGFVSNGKPTFCVGIKTKKLLEANNFNVVASSDYAEDLAQIITSDYRSLHFSFFNGNLRRETLPDAFKKAKIVFEEFTVYETVLNPVKSDQKYDGILFFSPSAIESFLKNNSINNATCFCIGTTTALALDQTTNVVISDPPTIEHVIQDCLNHFKNIK